MTTVTENSAERSKQFADRYSSALEKFLVTGGESALEDAFDLGRQALSSRMNLLEILAVHKQVLARILLGTMDERHLAEMVSTSSDFLAECVSPYELAHRGFQDAMGVLRQVNETLEAEIKRIAYAVHDEAGQLLVAVHLALAEMCGELPEAQKLRVRKIEELLNEVEDRLRHYSHELRPTILDDLGLIPAIHHLADGISKRSRLRIHIRASYSGRLPGSMEIVLYRIVQEALTNCVKHAKANNVWIHVWNEESMLCCSIKDDGIGFVPRSNKGLSRREGLGLLAMQERLSAISGGLEIKSAVGMGTELFIRVPVESACVNSYIACG